LLGVFAKIPDREPVKTRLQARLSAEDAARFQLAALADVLETTARVVPEPWLFLSHGADDRDRVGALLAAHGLDAAAWRRVRVAPQHGADLGARMAHAFGDLCMATGGAPRAALLVGADSPALDPAMLRRGLDTLGACDVVLGPAADGGYWCIGVRAPVPSLFDGVPWSSPDTLCATAARAASLGLAVTLLEPWTDVDRPADLDVLARQVEALRAGGDAATARHVERWLRSGGWLRHDAASWEAEH
jgi:rSAM/selenodomain-associated transferase 1